MASIRTYRKKIKSAKNIAKITRAMQLVAASKMKRAQEAAFRGKEYANGMMDLSILLANYLDVAVHPLLAASEGKNGKNLVVLIAPEKGLCGSLITNLAKKVDEVVTENTLSDCEFITIGKKASQVAQKLGLVSIAEFQMGLSYPKYEVVPPIARLIEDRFVGGLLKKVVFIFAEFVSTMTQVPNRRVLLPLHMIAQDQKVAEDFYSYYLFEPSSRDIIEPFLEMYLEVQIYQILLEAYASEQSARMVAMKNATDNANSLISELTIDYNKIRQSAITNEILDIGNAKVMLLET